MQFGSGGAAVYRLAAKCCLPCFLLISFHLLHRCFYWTLSYFLSSFPTSLFLILFLLLFRFLPLPTSVCRPVSLHATLLYTFFSFTLSYRTFPPIQRVRPNNFSRFTFIAVAVHSTQCCEVSLEVAQQRGWLAEVRGTYGGEDKCVQGSGGNVWWEEPLEHLGLTGDNTKIDPKRTGWEGMDWLHLAHDKDEWPAVVNTAMTFQVPYNAVIYFTSRGQDAFWSRRLRHTCTSMELFSVVGPCNLSRKLVLPRHLCLPKYTASAVRSLWPKVSSQSTYSLHSCITSTAVAVLQWCSEVLLIPKYLWSCLNIATI